jgi:ankyrin repeat protein/ketosteroid isomerase-like protein
MAADFLAASIEGRPRQARDLVAADPAIPTRDLRAATVLGEADIVASMLAANPEAAVAIDDDRGWPPLLYACYSRWHQLDPQRATGLADVVRALLAAGANPNTNDGGRPRFRSALKGAVEVDNPAVVEVLLDAGAHPDPGQPIGEAAGRADHRCLELLLAHHARVAGTWAVGAAIHADDPGALRLLLNALTSDEARATATDALPEAATQASLPVVIALLDAGADPSAAHEDISAHRRAIRAGKPDIADRLRAAGAPDDATETDRFVGAALAGDRATATRLRANLTDQDQSLIVDAAGDRPAETIALMLDVGFAPGARNELGEQPLHNAAYWGNAPVVRLLLDAGAEVDARDARFDATPLAFATVGSGEQAGKQGDWPGTVRLLLEAGASRQDVWVNGKPPSEELVPLLRDYGIAPETDDVDEPAPGDIGTGPIADIARQLKAAYENGDLDLLASLLHPDVHWTGLCTNSTQVIDWYRRLHAEGAVPTVLDLKVDGDTVVIGLSVSRPAEGARPVPQRVNQVFTVDSGQIVRIGGHPA